VHSVGHQLLDLRCRDPQPDGVLGPIFRDQRARDIVAVARAALYCMARRHPVAIAINQQAGEQARLTLCARVPLGGVARKLRLNRIPQRLLDDWRVLARMGLLLVNDLAAARVTPSSASYSSACSNTSISPGR
jgi:hypothetical protein